MENECLCPPSLVIEYGNAFIELPSKEVFFGDLIFLLVVLFSQTIVFSFFVFSFPPLL